ncbi:hypothetical protein ACT3UD_00095 [Glutamicibacter sp. 287]|uniref:hypothetical protein n=1 Tax=unclassified Glutamicibacter TaxID=2627139 RepID=UPI000BB696F3|nr:hypothetical protein [Glutamicibacter sp. BW80]PCC29232.1 hypothetical protein CIK76_07395 [Glutamicibacter sp. BW80]
MEKEITFINDHRADPARLQAPTDNGFALIAIEVGHWAGPFPLPTRARSEALDQVEPLLQSLNNRDNVIEATAFRAALRPPGEGGRLLRAAGVAPARYDIVLLVRTRTVTDLDAIRTDQAWQKLVTLLDTRARRMHQLTASSPARIADVDHDPGNVFLFNYFHSADPKTVRAVWEYTAGWFQRTTALADSVPMQPLPEASHDYALINHCSWPNFRSFLPHLLLRPSFRRFVLANFAANTIAAQPIIYRRHM